MKFGKLLFIVSAYLCFSNFKIKPEETLYSRPENPTTFYAFDTKIRARAHRSTDDEHYDQVILRVAQSHHPESETDKVVALDLARTANSRLPTSGDIVDFIVRGYPFDCPNHRIDYDLTKITSQAYVTNGHLSVNKSPSDFCYLVRMITPIPEGMDPNGVSGSPLYGITKNEEPIYCGTIIKYSEITGEYLVVGPEVLVNALRGCADPTSSDA